MNNQEFNIANLENLRTLQRSKINNLVNEQLKFEENWIGNKKCACVNELRFGMSLNCKHIQRAMNEKFKKEEKSMRTLGLYILLSDLRNNPQFLEYWQNRRNFG